MTLSPLGARGKFVDFPRSDPAPHSLDELDVRMFAVARIGEIDVDDPHRVRVPIVARVQARHGWMAKSDFPSRRASAFAHRASGNLDGMR